MNYNPQNGEHAFFREEEEENQPQDIATEEGEVWLVFNFLPFSPHEWNTTEATLAVMETMLTGQDTANML